jgi:hypothetical protein
MLQKLVVHNYLLGFFLMTQFHFIGTACYDLKHPLMLLSELCQGKQKK